MPNLTSISNFVSGVAEEEQAAERSHHRNTVHVPSAEKSNSNNPRNSLRLGNLLSGLINSAITQGGEKVVSPRKEGMMR